MKYLIHTIHWLNLKLNTRKETVSDDLEGRMLEFSGGVYFQE